MNGRWLRSVVLLALLVACSRTILLKAPESVPLRVTYFGESRTDTLSPGSDEYKSVVAWINGNRSGWSPYLATNPTKGVLITGEGLWLQFLDSTALTKTQDGLFSKTVAPSDYAFLQHGGETPNKRLERP
jgi:hypothetical protein